MASEITADDLGKLIPYGIPIAHWLKENNPKRAADTLAGIPDIATKSNVENSLKQFLAALDVSGTDLSNAQLRYILSQYDCTTWAHALKKIVCEASNPSLIEDSVKRDLLDWAYYFQKEGGTNWDELFEEIGKSMNTLGHTSFQVLGEFCSLVRDCSQDSGSDTVARAIGVDVLKSGDSGARSNRDTIHAAGILFQKFVFEAERIFGQSGSTLGIVSFGIRSKVESTQWSLVHTLPPEKKHMQDLRTFYSYIDKKFVGIVEDLFRYHDFVDIAEAINTKYGMIPAPWKSTLQKMKQDKKYSMNWFDYSSIKTPTPGAHGPPKARNFPPPPEVQPTEDDVLVDNFIDTEILYYRRLGALGNVYVKRLLQIAEAKTEEAQNLGLSLTEIDSLFGYRFQKVLDLTHQFLTSLEVINLTRKHVKGGLQREQILAQIVKKIAPQDLYAAYAHYSVTYPQCAEMLKRKVRRKQVAARNGVRPSGMDFLDIWDQVKRNIRSLDDKKLEEVMELPVKRIHNYRDFLKQLLSNAPQNSTKYKDIFDAYSAVRDAAQQLTNASAHHAQQIPQ